MVDCCAMAASDFILLTHLRLLIYPRIVTTATAAAADITLFHIHVQSTDWLIDLLKEWLNDWLDWLINWLSGWLIDSFIDCVSDNDCPATMAVCCNTKLVLSPPAPPPHPRPGLPHRPWFHQSLHSPECGSQGTAALNAHSRDGNFHVNPIFRGTVEMILHSF